MIGGQGIDAGLDIGEVALKQDRHVGVKPPPVGDVYARLRPRLLAGTLAHGLGQAPHDHAVSDIPGNPRQLPCAVGDAGGELGDGIGHAVAPKRRSSIINATTSRCPPVPGTFGTMTRLTRRVWRRDPRDQSPRPRSAPWERLLRCPARARSAVRRAPCAIRTWLRAED